MQLVLLSCTSKKSLVLVHLRTAVIPSLSLTFSRMNNPTLSLCSYIMWAVCLRARNISCVSNTLPKGGWLHSVKKSISRRHFRVFVPNNTAQLLHIPQICYLVIPVMQSRFLIWASEESETRIHNPTT